MKREGSVNGYAALVRERKGTKRRPLDDYETPPEVTRALLQHVSFTGPVLEPAEGSGRMSAVLREAGLHVHGADIKVGADFLRPRARAWPGDIITNPAYRDDLDNKFVAHALALADGKIAMLMNSRFLWGNDRASSLYAKTPPAAVIIIPQRIMFEVEGEPITSQFFNHCWIVWPERQYRGPQTQTFTFWADLPSAATRDYIGSGAETKTWTPLSKSS